MTCPNCRCEIGNLTVCPYCGARQRSVRTTPVTRPNQPGTVTPVQTRTPAPTKNVQTRPVYRSEQSGGRANRHMSNIDTWSLMCVILLAGIFVMELLQLVLLVLD